MEVDERTTNYMKLRNEYAKAAAAVAAAQLFSLAGFFCMYALYKGDVFYSQSLRTAKAVIIIVMIAVSICLAVINAVCIGKLRRVRNRFPDEVALRGSEEILRNAYIVARPVLIEKITRNLLILPLAGLVYIFLLLFMDVKGLADIYGKIIVCLAFAVLINSAIPCIDRIDCYRKLLKEKYESRLEEKTQKRKNQTEYVAAVTVPLLVLVYCLMRFFSSSYNIAWICIPVGALVCVAVIFLVEWNL